MVHTSAAARAGRRPVTRYRVRHSTEYRYSGQVVNGHTIAHLRPRTTPFQQVHAAEVTTTPAADHADEYDDSFGNCVSYRAIEQAHDRLTVVALSEVDAHEHDVVTSSPPWEDVARLIAEDDSADGLLARMCSMQSALVGPSADLARFASWSFLPGRPVHEAVGDLCHRIFSEFAFDPGFSDISTPPADVLIHRRGVCQDFAHLSIGCFRSLGLPARYVSGYVENEPLPGEVKMVGGDASHAWCSVYVPGFGWLDADPTNDQVPPRSHVTVAWGRDYADVAPVRGVLFGSPASQELSVAVEVTRLEDH
ncbi:MAG TPA: transglutaminase family protein [Ilumatobacteraceae bacterium]|nr:transglutaminase family protein [Ilumatobacteraceae bacterium]